MDNNELFINHGNMAAEPVPEPPVVDTPVAPSVQEEETEELAEQEQVATEPTVEQVEEVGETFQIDHTVVPEPTSIIDNTPDPLADIEAKIAGYPLPTPEIGNMRPPTPPRPSFKHE